MEKIEGEFRQTGMGAFHGTAIVEEGRLVYLDEHSRSVYEGRGAGYELYSLEVPEGTIWLDFYRSNRGNERVIVKKAGDDLAIQDFRSFQRAKIWVAKGCPE